MTQQPDTSETPPAPPPLKVVEPDIDPKDPWRDDKLGRQEIAKRLTGIVQGQAAPFVISVDGRWGTGKTFLLKRWRQALYYNAWEDDFAGDPLLSIVGQLSEHLDKTPLLQRVIDCIPSLVRIGLSAAVSARTGVSVTDLPGGQQAPGNDIASYLEKRDARDQLKESLAALAKDVRKNTGQPLVFIIDELDRCRPTFAIELLERVKHIFDVPNIVFVFGVNRSELLKSLQSIYGKIDAGTYLRRFFDMEFVLPDANPEQFCNHLLEQFGMGAYFEEADRGRRDRYYQDAYDEIIQLLPVVMGRMGLSLRDMDYCVRLVALAARESLKRRKLFPALLVLLTATKLTEPELYRRFVQGDARGAELINHLKAQRPLRPLNDHAAAAIRDTPDWLEAEAYYADDPECSLQQLKRLENGEGLDEPSYVSAELAALDLANEENMRRLQSIIAMVEQQRGFGPYMRYAPARRWVTELIDLYADFVRR